jgi:heat shock protein HtpX
MKITQVEASTLIEPVSLPRPNRVTRQQTLRAVGMIIGYYVFALAILVGLSFATLVLMVVLFPAAGLTMVGAISILVSIVPRPDFFRAPGPRVNAESQPRLFQALSEIAETIGQKMPSEVYLIPDANAWVAERGGFLGIGRRRVMCIGLPLLSTLTVSEFRGVMAHEFGHYYSRDTEITRWIGSTRDAMIRNIEMMSSSKYSQWLHLYFVEYADWFLRSTQDISRRQEFLADELAAWLVGSQSMVDGLLKIHSGDYAFHAYWNGAIAPLLEFGVHPPILQGFSRFMATTDISSSMGRTAERKLKEDKTDIYDSHPALPERIAAVKVLPVRSWQGEDPPALSLMENVEQIEDVGLLGLVRSAKRYNLRPISWEDALTQAYIPMWEKTVQAYAPGLAGITSEALPGLVNRLSEFGFEMLKKSNRQREFMDSAQITARAVGASLALALHKAGWDLHVLPGEPICAERDGQQIMPFEVLGKLASHRLSADSWRNQCMEAGIAGVDFGTLVPAEAAA